MVWELVGDPKESPLHTYFLPLHSTPSTQGSKVPEPNHNTLSLLQTVPALKGYGWVREALWRSLPILMKNLLFLLCCGRKIEA